MLADRTHSLWRQAGLQGAWSDIIRAGVRLIRRGVT